MGKGLGSDLLRYLTFVYLLEFVRIISPSTMGIGIGILIFPTL